MNEQGLYTAGANKSLLNESVNEGMICSLVLFAGDFPRQSEFLKIIATVANQSLTMSQAQALTSVQSPCMAGSTVTPNLQSRKLRPREIN